MDEPGGVRGVECVGDLRDDLDGPPGLQAAVLEEHAAQVGAVDVAHRPEVEVPALRLRGDDARVVHRGREAPLTVEAGPEPRVPARRPA